MFGKNIFQLVTCVTYTKKRFTKDFSIGYVCDVHTPKTFYKTFFNWLCPTCVIP